jgi:hypothetical protein
MTKNSIQLNHSIRHGLIFKQNRLNINKLIIFIQIYAIYT